MIRFLIVPSLLFLLITSCGNKKAEVKTFKDSLSYAIGVNIATNIDRDKIDINVDVLAAAMKDFQAKDTSVMTKADVETVMKNFSVKQQKKMQDERAKQQKEQEAKDLITYKDNKEKGEEFLKENAAKQGVKTTASGLQYKVLKAGNGNIPKSTDKVQVHYKGTLIDGTEFDSSHKRGKPAEFGVTRVIRGWTEALQLMKEGAKYELYIPQDLAYGSRSTGQHIKPFSALIFEVELISILDTK